MTAHRYPFAVIREKLRARHGQVADFAIGSLRPPLPPGLQAVLAAMPDTSVKPASPDDIHAFRQAAANFLLQEYRVSLQPNEIVPVPGGRVAMTAVAACVLAPGDVVVVTEPGYPAFSRLAKHWHAEVRAIELNPQDNFAPDFSSLTSEDLSAMRLLSLNYPNNPTGAVLTANAADEIVRVTGNADAIVLNDAVYAPLVYEGEPTSLLRDNGPGRPIELHGLTKLYSIGPQGASFLVGSGDLMRQISTYSEFAWSPMSALQIQTTTWCLNDEQGRAATKALCKARIESLRDCLTDIGFRLHPTPAGLYVLCEVPSELAGNPVHTAEEAAMLLLDELDLAVMPWDSAKHRYLRFSSMYRSEDLNRLSSLRDKLLIA